MKRRADLIPLSREHHGALSLARRIQTEAEDSAHLAERVRSASAELLAHFAQEEALFLSVLDVTEPGLGTRLREEHAMLRDYLHRIGEGEIACLPAFASLLAQHVRFEERELFPAFESLT